MTSALMSKFVFRSVSQLFICLGIFFAFSAPFILSAFSSPIALTRFGGALSAACIARLFPRRKHLAFPPPSARHRSPFPFSAFFFSLFVCLPAFLPVGADCFPACPPSPLFFCSGRSFDCHFLFQFLFDFLFQFLSVSCGRAICKSCSSLCCFSLRLPQPARISAAFPAHFLLIPKIDTLPPPSECILS